MITVEYNDDGTAKRVFSQELGFEFEPFEVADCDGFAGMELAISETYIKAEQLDKVIELLQKAKTEFKI
jgi:hypothetical protein